jgi:hypothetical protein
LKKRDQSFCIKVVGVDCCHEFRQVIEEVLAATA